MQIKGLTAKGWGVAGVKWEENAIGGDSLWGFAKMIQVINPFLQMISLILMLIIYILK